jgi:ketosteroid isomerase-like protein
VIRETTITFENVQHVKVHQGPLQRHYGIANVEVTTAGGGSAAGHEGAGQSTSTHVGMIEGVSDAARIRDLIMAKVRQSRAAGLGDEDHRGAPGWTGAHINVLREIRDSMALARIAIMALLFLGACTADEPVAELITSPEELMEADREFAAETAARGLDGWMSFYADDAARVQLGTASVRGPEGIRGFDAEMFDDSTTRLLWEPTDAGVFEDGRHGFTTGRSAFVRIDGDIPDTLSMGRYVTIWRLDSEGRPRVILDTGVQDP